MESNFLLDLINFLRGLFLFGSVVGLYFFPTIMASGRGHKQVPQIFLTNLFFGWTFVGWVIALIWSFRRASEVVVAPTGASISAQTNLPVQPDDSKICPQCAETIKAAAKICRYCHFEFPEPKVNREIQPIQSSAANVSPAHLSVAKPDTKLALKDEIDSGNKKTRNLVFLTIFGLGLVVAAGGGYVYNRSFISNSPNSLASAPEVFVLPVPTPNPIAAPAAIEVLPLRPLSREEIAELQRLLTARGFDTKGSDGNIGPATRDAILKFERSRNWPETGLPTTDHLMAARAPR